MMGTLCPERDGIVQQLYSDGNNVPSKNQPHVKSDQAIWKLHMEYIHTSNQATVFYFVIDQV